MRISKDTGRRENITGLVFWIMFIIVYYCLLSQILRGYIIPEYGGRMFSILDDLGTIGIALISVIAGLLTTRPLFRIYLKLKAYHVRKSAAWQDWRSKKQKDR